LPILKDVLRQTERSEAYWRDFVLRSGIDAVDYVVCSFGDSPAMATELAHLVIAGIKRATTSLARDYADGSDPSPKLGNYVVVVDGEGASCCIWRTVDIVVKPLDALDEGWLGRRRRQPDARVATQCEPFSQYQRSSAMCTRAMA